MLVPVMYSLVDDVATFFARHYGHSEEDEGAGESDRSGIDDALDDELGVGVATTPQPAGV